MSLKAQQCQPCRGDTPPLTAKQREDYLDQLGDWEIKPVAGEDHLIKTFRFDNFRQALDFTVAVGELAEEADHHPLVELTWGRVSIHWWTHTIGGLHVNDFIMADRCDDLRGA